jgi:hypothetical protein
VVLAAVGETAPAGIALLAIEIGFHSAKIPWLQMRVALPHGEDFDPEFVTGDPWIGEERHFAKVTAQVGPADADAENAHERLDPERGLAVRGSRFGARSRVSQAEVLS